MGKKTSVGGKKAVVTEKSREDFLSRREDLTNSLEVAYTMAMEQKDNEAACATLCSMMNFRTIEKDDSRLKLLSKEKVDIESARDYRRNTNNSSKFIWCELPSRVKLGVVSAEHMSKRVEGNYVGDISVDSRDVPLIISESIDTGFVKRFVEKIAELGKRNNMPKFNFGEHFAEDTKNGRYAVYTIRLQSGVNLLRNTFGYIMASFTEKDALRFYVFADYDNLGICYVSADAFNQSLTDTLKERMEQFDDELKVEVVFVNSKKEFQS